MSQVHRHQGYGRLRRPKNILGDDYTTVAGNASSDIIDNTDGFYSMYFNVKCIGHKPVWWPDDAHISFLYEYDRQFTQLQIDNVINRLSNKKCVLTKLQTMKCIDHFNKWEKMK